MKVDLRSFPFSCRGSYMVISENGRNWNGLNNEEGLYLRTVHSSAMNPFAARFEIGTKHEEMLRRAEIQEAALIISRGETEIGACFDSPDTLLIRGNAESAYGYPSASETGPAEE